MFINKLNVQVVSQTSVPPSRTEFPPCLQKHIKPLVEAVFYKSVYNNSHRQSTARKSDNQADEFVPYNYLVLRVTGLCGSENQLVYVKYGYSSASDKTASKPQHSY